MASIRIGQLLDLNSGKHLKFLITKDSEGFVFHCGVASSHALLSAKLGLSRESILGGGEMDVVHGDTLVLDEYSFKYGGVPKEVLEPLIPELLRETNVKTVIIDTQFSGPLENWQ